MRLTIFWRIILAQSALIALILLLSIYALAKLNRLSEIDSSILTVDTACIIEDKQLLKTFFAEMRNAEKYLLSRDDAFYTGLIKAREDFSASLGKVHILAASEQERELTREIASFHERYHQEFELAVADTGSWERAKEEISEELIGRVNELLRLREQILTDKTADARDQAANAAQVIGWATLGGLLGALLLAFFHARGVSRPLSRLAQEMQLVGRGEFSRTVNVRAPKEVHELANTFNRMTEQLAELDQLKSDFTAHVSHELRTPLAAIREGTALLLEEIPGPLSAAQREILEVVRSHSERLLQSISSILDLSKMEAQMMHYDLLPCDLGIVIKTSLGTVELIARNKGIVLRTSMPDTLPILTFDEARIHQVLDNLLSNALKFTPEGGIVSVSASLSSDHGETEPCVEVRVSDTGDGIPPEEIARVFTRYYQSPYTRGQSRQGTGLGLAIARHVIKAHGGKIWAESEHGQGSTFVFTLPLNPQKAEAFSCLLSQEPLHRIRR